MKTIQGKGFFALLCDDLKYRKMSTKNAKPDPMLCGVFATEREARECADSVKDCLCKHKILKVDVLVEPHLTRRAKRVS